MLLGSILLALAWAALQGEITLDKSAGRLRVRLRHPRAAGEGRRAAGDADVENAHAVELAGFFVRELVLANVRVAIDVLRPRTAIRPAVVAIPLDVTSDGEILLLSMLINITPGSVTIDLSDDRRTLYVHVMHMTSAEASRREIKEGFERRVKLLFAAASQRLTGGDTCLRTSRRS